jgi:hypothetical protein
LLVEYCDTIAYFVVEFGAVGEHSKGSWRRGENRQSWGLLWQDC